MIDFKKKKTTLLACASLLALGVVSTLAVSTPIFANATEQSEQKTEDGHETAEAAHEDEGKVTIDPQAAADMKIVVTEAQPAVIYSATPVTGKISLNRNAMAEVKARFNGVVKSVTKTQGETVKAGEILATVEANDSLQVYAVKSPINGIVLARNTNIGYIAGEEPLFIVADLSKLWGEFHIFPKDMEAVTTGQTIKIKAVGSDLTAEAKIVSLLPLTESTSQTVIARAEIDNGAGKWRPGMSVHGDIYTAEKNVPVAVKASALQREEGRSVVFVEKDGSYTARKVTLGLQNNEWLEVTKGLEAGERYVSDNSFIVKAQVGKAGAAHED